MSSYPNLVGSIPALVTPMFPNGDIDYSSFKQLIDWHVEQGSDALVIAGTSGESPTLSVQEHTDLIKLAVDYSAGRLPIIAGVGANATKEAVHLSEQAQKAGAVAGLSTTPYYNKPTQEGLFLHYKYIAEHCDLPTILYDVPGRTVVAISNETVLRLAELPNIMGIKDATGDISRLGELIAHKPKHFQVYSGDDATAAALILLGGQANISVTANIAPKLMHDLCMAAYNGDLATVRQINGQLAHLNKILFIEANPIPIKFALAKMNKTQLGYRLPLCPLSQKNEQVVTQALQQAHLI